MGEGERNPFKHRNVVEAMLGDAPSPARGSGLPTALDALEKEKAKKERRAKLRRMKPWQRRKYERDARRVKLTVYLPRPLSSLVDEVARHEIVSPSSAASWLIATGLKLWREGKVQSPVVVGSRNLRTQHSLAIPSEWNGKREKRTFDLPDFRGEIVAMAKEYGCGTSDAVAWLMSVGADEYRSGKRPEREASDSIRYPFRLKLPRIRKPAAGEGENESPADILRRFMDR